jgi:hypothetical protein
LEDTVIGPAYGEGVIVSVQGIHVCVDLAHSADNTNYSPTDLSWGLPDIGLSFAGTGCSGPPLIPAVVVGFPLGPGPNVTPFRPAVAARNGTTVTLYIAGTSSASTQQFKINRTIQM